MHLASVGGTLCEVTLWRANCTGKNGRIVYTDKYSIYAIFRYRCAKPG